MTLETCLLTLGLGSILSVKGLENFLPGHRAPAALTPWMGVLAAPLVFSAQDRPGRAGWPRVPLALDRSSSVSPTARLGWPWPSHTAG